jgi:hypothetical protein
MFILFLKEHQPVVQAMIVKARCVCAGLLHPEHSNVPVIDTVGEVSGSHEV